MNTPHTLVHQLQGWASSRPDSNAIHGRKPEGGWNSWTWQQYWDDARAVGRGLIALGHEVGDCVAIVGDNRPEWSLCEFGIMAARGVPAPIYTTLTSEQVAYIVAHSEAKIAICDKAEQLDKYLEALEAGLTPTVERIITMDTIESDDERVMSFAALLELGREADTAEGDKRIEELTADETALLIYTSGTTGTPKAVQLTHGGMVHMSKACLDRFSPLRKEYRCVSYLPLCHVAEQLFTTMFHLDTGGEVYFCPDIKQIKSFLIDVRPTFFAGVPRVWEKFQAVLQGRLAESTGIKAMIGSWGLKTELDAFKAEVATGKPQGGFFRDLANKLVANKIKDALGLDKVIMAGTGAAPIGTETLEFFASLGICIYEGYGMSETTGLATLGVHGKPRFGSVGTALEGVTIKIADDDEILLKGPNMTRGYLRQDEKTAELLDDEGWLHTGDLGSLDSEGFLKITGRKKDLLITAGGKNVAPSEMEGYIKSIFGVSQAVVVGDAQPYLCALVTLDSEVLEDFATKVGVDKAAIEQLADDARVQAWVMEQVETRCNAKVARYQTIKKVKILPTDWTVDTGEVTPTMKIKRNVVSQRYASEISAFYAA